MANIGGLGLVPMRLEYSDGDIIRLLEASLVHALDGGQQIERPISLSIRYNDDTSSWHDSLLQPDLARFPIIDFGIYSYCIKQFAGWPDGALRALLSHLHHLESCNFKLNGIDRLLGPEGFPHFPCLKSLSLSGCDLPTFPQLPPTLESLNIQASTLGMADASHLNPSRLELLFLHRVKIKQWGASPIDLPHLKFLHCEEIPRADCLPPLSNIFAGCPALRKVILDGCQLAELPKEVGLLKDLQELSIPRLHSESLPDEIGNLHQLRVLTIYGSKLTRLPDTIIRLTNLQELNAHSCKLSPLPPHMDMMKSLTKLLLLGNPLPMLLRSNNALAVLRSSRLYRPNNGIGVSLSEILQVRGIMECG